MVEKHVIFFFQSYKTLKRWTNRDAFSFDNVPLSNVSSCSNVSQSSNDHTWKTYSGSSISEYQANNSSISSISMIKYQGSLNTIQAAEEHTHVPENNLSELSVTFNNRLDRSTVSIQGVRSTSDNNEGMIYYSEHDVENDSETSDSNEKFLNNVQIIHYSRCDIESDSDDADSESLATVDNNASSPMLCSNSCMTINSAILNFVKIYIANNKTNTCLKDDLRLLTSALPKPNQMPKTVFKLFQYIKQQALPCKAITHYCCKACQFYYGTSKQTLCSACNSDTGYIPFFEIDIISQVRYLFECKHLADVLDKAFQHRNTDTSIITDVTDGSEYKRVNIGRKFYDISLILSTDGACIKKSSTASLWLTSFTIMEVPPQLRHFFIMCIGIWYADTKPDMNTFLRPLCLKLRSCSKEGGLTWSHPTTGVFYTSLIKAPLIVADAPARAMVLNMQNHNGKHGCHTCEIKTKKIRSSQAGKIRRRVYKFRSHGWRIRTKKRMLTCGKHAELTNSISKGIKGRTIVHVLPSADESTIVFAEFMHLFCLGVIKQILTLWIEKSGEWNIKEHIDAIDDFLSKIKPPNTFGRLPRELKKRKFWKAYEHLYWALFYSLLAVKNYLPDKYFQHWMLLVIALNLLLQEKMHVSDLERTKVLLTQFVSEFGVLYGEAELTYNIHQLLHVTLNIQRWGPV